MNEAISLARQCEGTIIGVYIMPGLPPETAEGYRKYLSEKARKFMSDAKTNAGRHGILFEEKVITSNDTVNAIANLAKTNKFGIVVIGARGQSSPHSEYLGSVSNGVLHSCRVPVLVVK
jgi:nucleotide-binding universal stress UspA family protein